jgi:acyl-CoA synthetase (AMP-forming)/AMP-acid ligase II
VYSTIVELLRDRAQQHPDRVVFKFLKDGETEAGQMTYGDLDLKARAISAHLQPTYQPGDRALLVYNYDTALEFITAFCGCLYAGIVPVPNASPRNRYALTGLQARASSAGATLALTASSLLGNLKRQVATPEAPDVIRSLAWFQSDTLSVSTASNWKFPNLSAETLAFLQFTSGSTGLPKGVMVTHGGLLHNQQLLQLAFGHTEQCVGVGWLPLFHDMGLIGKVLQPLYLGTSSTLMSPLAFVQKPIRWLQAISRYQATTSGGPNFAYDLLCNQVNDEQLQQLDLSSWDVAFTGAEPVRAETLDRFATKFAPCGFRREAFYSCYGMAEAVLFISGGQKAEPPVIQWVSEDALEENRVVLTEPRHERSRSLVGCGHAWLDGQIIIVDPVEMTQCPPNSIGEVWIAGYGLGKGYWNQPEETERTFQAYLKDTGDGPFLRTGDLGFLKDGELFITGRMNDVLVFWGLNHYPHHIEQTVAECHPAFIPGSGAAFAIEVKGESRLVVVQELERSQRHSVTAEDVAETIRWQVFQKHFTDIYAIALVKPGGIPKTSSGKIQRRLCKTQFLDGRLDALSEWQSPQDERSDITTLIERYLNPMTHVQRLSAATKGRLRRFVAALTQPDESI